MAISFNPLSYPIVFSAPRTMSEASAWVQHIPFAMLITQLAAPRVFVELGTHNGDSYLAFCQAVSELQLQTKCYAVDTFTGDAHSGHYDASVLQRLRAAHDPIYSAFSTLLQSSFDDAREKFDNGQVDLLHIDGMHTYEAVKHDFEYWSPKLSDRAVVLFHDTAVREGDFGVWRLWQELAPRHLSFEFTHGYGLGVLTGANAPFAVADFLRFANSNASLVRQMFFALGERIEHFRRLIGVSIAMAHQSKNLQAMYAARNQPWPLPMDLQVILNNVLPYSTALAKNVETVAKENIALRDRVSQLEAQRKAT